MKNENEGKITLKEHDIMKTIRWKKGNRKNEKWNITKWSHKKKTPITTTRKFFIAECSEAVRSIVFVLFDKVYI